MTLPPQNPAPIDIDDIRMALLTRCAAQAEDTADFAVDPADLAALRERIHTGIIAELASKPGPPS